jgi:uncharacterized protein
MKGGTTRAGRHWAALLIMGISSIMGSCSRSTPEKRQMLQPSKGIASYEAGLEKERREKDEFFRSGAQSPLPPAMRSSFQGLKYFPVNPDFHFHLKLNRHPQPQSIRIGTNTGEVRSGLRYGYFEFEVAGQSCRLQAYRMNDDPADSPPSLFIPFKDATTGSETYGAGRYIEMRENTTGVYDLDFNRAFNPFCAYNSGYSCPVPPEENRLSISIRAGELAYAH